MDYYNPNLTCEDMNLNFKKMLRGYDINEVNSYISKILNDNKRLQNENLALKASISGYSKQDELIKSALIRAEESSLKLKIEAEKQAKIIIEEAEKNAYDIIKEAKNNAKSYTDDINKSFYGYERELKDVINNFYLLSRKNFQELEQELVNEVDSTIKRLNSNFNTPLKTNNIIKNNTSKHIETNLNNDTQDNYTKDIHLNKNDTSFVAYASENESSYLLGKVINKNIQDIDGYIIVKENTVITPQLVEYLISKGLYGKLIESVENINK